ncbi:MAG: hypothetical protein KIT09_10250 [Bryobacteraceae bacterium]|nr:hypothetical protein [Bryobacteraceae bacterium]
MYQMTANRLALWVTSAAFLVSCSSPRPAPGPEAKRAESPAAAAIALPAYSEATIIPSGGREPGPLAPGMLASIYGTNLGPSTPCHGTPEAERLETPNPQRPNQTAIERQVFPKRLCDTEVLIGGAAAGLLYVGASQINFKVPQEMPLEAAVNVQVSYRGRLGPEALVVTSRVRDTAPAATLAERIWSAFQAVEWDAPYATPARGSATACQVVTQHKDMRGGLYGYAYYCAETRQDIVAESLYYPVDYRKPKVLLRRADFRLANGYPEISVEMERLLRDRLTRAYGPGAVPDHLFEIGVHPPEPGLSWNAGQIAIFLHRSRHYLAPVGVREGVQLIAVRREVLDERERRRALDEAFRTSTLLAHAAIARDLKQELGGAYIEPSEHPRTDRARARAEHEAREALFTLLRRAVQGERAERPAVLVAADDLATRLGGLLVVHPYQDGRGEISHEVPSAAGVRRNLASYGVKYDGIGHYSGALEYDHSLLRRAWKEFPDTAWGQRAFLMLQRLYCSGPGFECKDFSCFRQVIEEGEKFLQDYPDTPFRREQLYHLALANETWWSLSQAAEDDSTSMDVQVDQRSGDAARKRAIELYEELIRAYPDSPEAHAGMAILPRLKLSLDTAERAFFCFSC